MHILVLADGRSPTTQNWLKGLLARRHAISLVSSYPCSQPLPGLERFEVLPIAFGQFASPGKGLTGKGDVRSSRRLIQRFRALFLTGRYWFGPISVQRQFARFQEIVSRLQPDLVHAMRIPYEGMLASTTPPGIPLVISTWGNDLTLHVHGSPWMRNLTERTLHRANGLLADTHRDVRLARSMGLSEAKPYLVVPGAGGLRLDAIQAAKNEDVAEVLAGTGSSNVPMVVNPRGIRTGSLRTDTFFRAIPKVIKSNPGVVFACPAMAGQQEALAWMERMSLSDSQVRLLPSISQNQLWGLFHHAQVLVSISEHDGTPNSLLEGMACGCLPIAGDIESLREWITPGMNGLLVPPGDADALAEAVCLGLEDAPLRDRAGSYNLDLVSRRAEFNHVMQQVEEFYRELIL